MTFPSHILAASDRCKELREELAGCEAIIKFLNENLSYARKFGSKPEIRPYLFKRMEAMIEKETAVKRQLFELEEDLTRDVLVEQFMQNQRTNLEYSDIHKKFRKQRKPSDLLLA